MKLIILDQAGVINQSSDTFIKTPEEWKPIPGSLEAIGRLTHAGYRVVIATNQSGIGRGLLDMATYNTINDKMYKAVNQMGGRIDAIFFCPHTSADQCTCRKPAIGMFDEIVQRYGVTLKTVPIVGDSLKDLQAAAAVGAIPILVLTGNGQTTHAHPDIPANTQVFENLAAAVDTLVGEA
ncbi:D-glycero-beta-D-manno-heptose 1,7-bisphosphate 7-phosphatase [Nitrosomonas sp. JL21]|uniref:D-glycero-beta-D-manno-heptose 1,7-bisphosphate 7-phosphatase n=1 Tax=Nitrosomonas sp. JL21 TaxID=153949 RepID=UPI001368FC0B|nr:D-glycero-beta-D-manno-heptose 1,7-bisphosphate 7-phosphatase [Nitrosomonas sp. JL21]MBL8496592.1 D-glycero-beta-D-manno-heptose 1,7-bisphosphate 7-phosphatase [Nitrosomonas sp.]MCC7090846.1 D-glycero-beta-D-manno-heptose 1,7-bisphosphate 7-phosphatase [Nitrosomonas sp.]MXS76494.1 D-glycero-beta-D-manno-heptose 1,7-bisphosphate 7-phosphatase [Nitrosomonas sp. JL21]